MVYLNHVDENEKNWTKIHVKEREVTWAPLIRVRSGGLVKEGWKGGDWKVPKYLNQTDYCTQ